MTLVEMLELYRNTAAPNMLAIAKEFRQLMPSEQRELLFWMCVDASTNPTTVRSENVRHSENGNASQRPANTGCADPDPNFPPATAD